MLPSTHELGITFFLLSKNERKYFAWKTFPPSIPDTPSWHLRADSALLVSKDCYKRWKNLWLSSLNPEWEMVEEVQRFPRNHHSDCICLSVFLLYTRLLPKVWLHYGSKEVASFVPGLRKSRWQCGKGWQSYWGYHCIDHCTDFNTQYYIVREKAYQMLLMLVVILWKILEAAQ